MTDEQFHLANSIKQQIYNLEAEVSGLRALDKVKLPPCSEIVRNKSFVSDTEDETYQFHEQKAASDFIEKLITIRKQRIYNLNNEFKAI